MAKAKLSSLRKERPRPWVYLISVGLISCANCITMIIGAMSVFNSTIAVPTAITIQVMLFLLVSNFVVRHSVIKQFLCVCMCSLLCMYASFFAYYGFINSEFQEQVEYARAFQAHQSFMTEASQAIDAQKNQLEEDAYDLNRGKIRGEGTTVVFEGWEERRKEKISQLLEQNAAEYQRLEQLQDEALSYSVNKFSPESIFARDLEAISKITPYLDQDIQLDSQDYVAVQDLDISDFAPFEIFLEKDRDAATLVALAFATLPILIQICVAYFWPTRKSKRLSTFNRPSQKQKTVAEAYLALVGHRSHLSSLLLLISLSFHIIISFLSRGAISYELVITSSILLTIIYLRLVVLRFRVYKGLYGGNYYEAKEIISFAARDEHRGGMPPPGSRKVFPRDARSLSPDYFEEGSTVWR